ncbi:unnamed protein product [Ambrosiozyma monospora]|uniref:Unnamed protein product n=1 Tax=Ambrosiozyma monospora TaxID=43982 RepID=A0ACB5TBD7_AMBMO|nr:unnamed protein product [Ambrosiozyma monospora]
MSETTPNNNDQGNDDTFNEDVNMDPEKSTIQPKYTRIAHKLKIHGDNLVSTVKFSPDGKYLATASSDMTVRIWRIFQQQQANTSISSNSNDGVASLQLERTLKGHTKESGTWNLEKLSES